MARSVSENLSLAALKPRCLSATKAQILSALEPYLITNLSFLVTSYLILLDHFQIFSTPISGLFLHDKKDVILILSFWNQYHNLTTGKPFLPIYHTICHSGWISGYLRYRRSASYSSETYEMVHIDIDGQICYPNRAPFLPSGIPAVEQVYHCRSTNELIYSSQSSLFHCREGEPHRIPWKPPPHLFSYWTTWALWQDRYVIWISGDWAFHLYDLWHPDLPSFAHQMWSEAPQEDSHSLYLLVTPSHQIYVAAAHNLYRFV